MDYAITVDHFSKSYGQVNALTDVTVGIRSGQITCLLGPNGAGKSTLIKSMVGALNPTAGSVRVLGHDPIRQAPAVRRQLGYMPQEPALYDDLSGRENVAFYARLHRLPDARAQADNVLGELDLGSRLTSPVFTLSGGMQRRVSLAAALVHNPPLLILDEPTAALDPVLKRKLWDRFRQMARDGKTLIISTHLVDEAMLCDTVVLLQHGRVIAHDAPRSLIATGRAVLTLMRNGRTTSETLPANGVEIATALRRHGLDPAIEQVQLEEENLEDVMVAKLEQEGRP